MDERERVARLKQGDAEAFDQIYAEYSQRLYGFLLRLSGRRDLADDLFQETWLRLVRHAERLRDDSDLGAWLYTVARNLHHSRGRLTRLEERVRVELTQTPATGDGGEQAAARMRLERLEAALLELPEASREVLLLVVVDGVTQDRAAAVLGLSHEALRQRLSRARQLLRERLDEAARSRKSG